MKYIAWYTKDTLYEESFKKVLEPSLIKYGLDYKVYPVVNNYRWNINVAKKPSIILHALQEFKEPIVVVDVDAKITNIPLLFNTIDVDKYDMACHYLDWATWYNKPSVRKELLTGTLWFNYNGKVITLLKEWDTICSAHNCADQLPLESLIQNKYQHIRKFDLPLDYVYITSLPDGKEPFVKVDKPVISHYQASRSAKRGLL